MLSRHVAYGAASMFKSLLHNIFLLYHVEMFVSLRKIDPAGFWYCESMFLVYNCLNDFIAGSMSDHSLLAGIVDGLPHSSPSCSERVAVGTIRQRIRYD
jgi:hypothetical protein